MPDWNSKDLSGVKDFIVRFTKAMNTIDLRGLADCFAEDAILHRAMKNYRGRTDIVTWYKAQLGAGNIQFSLMDAAAGQFPDSSIKCILWYEITARGNGKVKKDIHIETLDLIKHNESWKIRNCFGMGYNPKERKRWFS